MAARSCHNCMYVRVDPEHWLRCLAHRQPLVPRCANHPCWPGQLHDVPGTPCRNYTPKHPEPADETKRIPLGDGHYALVDAADYEWLRQYNWRLQNGYAARRNKTRTTYMHREIMKPPKGMMVDHVNHNKRDNRRANLRICTRQQNTQNNASHAGASSRFKGVSYCREKDKWLAKIWFEGQRIWLGYFLDEAEAARAYDRAAVELFGEFAHLNFPKEWPPNKRAQVHAHAQAERTKKARAEKKKANRKKPKAKARQPKTARRRPSSTPGKKHEPKVPARASKRKKTAR